MTLSRDFVARNRPELTATKIATKNSVKVRRMEFEERRVGGILLPFS